MIRESSIISPFLSFESMILNVTYLYSVFFRICLSKKDSKKKPEKCFQNINVEIIYLYFIVHFIRILSENSLT